MASAAGAAAARGASLPILSHSSSRKEWRAVSEQHARTNVGDDSELERSKLEQSDERTIYEVQQGRELVDVDFCSITADGSSDNEILHQQIQSVSRRREDLQHLEIELKAQLIARSEIVEMQNSFNAQIKEHVDAASKLEDQLHEKERMIRELERKMEDKDRELHAIKLDNEAAWAKEDLLREQNKELATFRRERDHSEVERAQHIKQIHELQEHIQEKERQLLELQEQNRIAQETILYKDEQLREAQAWISRVQEMDALQSTTNHSLQAELRERTEQYNQLWLGFQRQFAEMERLHLHTVQQLQLELADARSRNSSNKFTDETHMPQTNSNNAPKFVQKSGNQLDANGGTATSANAGVIPNGNSEHIQHFTSPDNPLAKTNHGAGLPIAPSSLLGMPAYLPAGQLTSLHSVVVHQQGAANSMPRHVSQSHIGNLHSMLQIPSIQQHQKATSEASGIPTHDQNSASQGDCGSMTKSVDAQMPPHGYVDVQMSQGAQVNTVSEKSQADESVNGKFVISHQSEGNLQQISLQFPDGLRLNSCDQNQETTEQGNGKVNNEVCTQIVTVEQNSSGAASSPDASFDSLNDAAPMVNNGISSVLPETLTSRGMVGRSSETALLDERSLLACIVRTIPAGGRIRIGSTLPNRLGKMLAPLHWHDYKKKYGKLDDFVASHPELFVVEGDYVQLQEGAQKIVAASAAVAKVAAAAAVSSPYSSYVAVTPVAQSHGLKKVPSLDSSQSKIDKTLLKESLSEYQNQRRNGVSFVTGEGGVSNIRILTKPKDPQGRANTDFSAKQQGRSIGASAASRR